MVASTVVVAVIARFLGMCRARVSRREQESSSTRRCKMKVWHCDDTRPVPGLVPSEVETPHPQRGEALTRVHAVGVTHTEMLWQPTTQTKSGENRRHAIPGREFSGTIAAFGAEAGGAVGDEVFGMNDWYAQGATAEFCRALPSAIAPK